MARNIALILAAGRGRRAGEGIPKTYRAFNGEIVIRRTVKAFLNHDQIDAVQLVIHPDDEALYYEALEDLGLPEPAFGGETRADSVLNGLKKCEGFDNVLIHDGARPFVSDHIISSVIKALEAHQGAIPALPVTDAVWEIKVDSCQLLRPVPREKLRRAQTPQGFHIKDYLPVASGGNVLDDAEAACAAGLDVVFVEGDQRNIKLTFAEDFEA